MTARKKSSMLVPATKAAGPKYVLRIVEQMLSEHYGDPRRPAERVFLSALLRCLPADAALTDGSKLSRALLVRQALEGSIVSIKHVDLFIEYMMEAQPKLQAEIAALHTEYALRGRWEFGVDPEQRNKGMQ